MRVILYNIEYLEGTTRGLWEYLDFYHLFKPKLNLDKGILKFLKSKNPDVVGLVEIDGGNFRRDPDMVSFFKDSLNFKGAIHDVKYGHDTLFHRLPFLKNQQNALFAKNKFRAKKSRMLSEGVKRLVLQSEYDFVDSKKNLQKITFLLVHLALFHKTRSVQIKEICDMVNEIDTPVVLMGDFNTFSKHELDYIFDNTSLVDSFSARKEGSLSATEPSWKPKHRLDNILVSKSVLVKNYEICELHFSDHLPVMVDFELKKDSN